jgi:hypothetical protein
MVIMHLVDRHISSADTEDLEISVRLILEELRRRINPRSDGIPYNYAVGILNRHDDDTNVSERLIKFAFENVGMQMARVVYKFFAPSRLNPETTIASLAKRKGWKEYANQDSVELQE